MGCVLGKMGCVLGKSAAKTAAKLAQGREAAVREADAVAQALLRPVKQRTEEVSPRLLRPTKAQQEAWVAKERARRRRQRERRSGRGLRPLLKAPTTASLSTKKSKCLCQFLVLRSACSASTCTTPASAPRSYGARRTLSARSRWRMRTTTTSTRRTR